MSKKPIKYTNSQLRALRWINENDHTKSQWLTNGKSAKGDPRNWDQIELSGNNGMIRIDTADWDAIVDMVQGEALNPRRIFALTPAGLAALEE